MKGTGKLQKMRFAFQDKGKDNLTKAECNAIKEIIKRMEKQLQEKEDT